MLFWFVTLLPCHTFCNQASTKRLPKSADASTTFASHTWPRRSGAAMKLLYGWLYRSKPHWIQWRFWKFLEPLRFPPRRLGPCHPPAKHQLNGHVILGQLSDNSRPCKLNRNPTTLSPHTTQSQNCTSRGQWVWTKRHKEHSMQRQWMSFGYSYQSMAGTLGEVLHIESNWHCLQNSTLQTPLVCAAEFDLKVKVPQLRFAQNFRIAEASQKTCHKLG